MGGGQGVVTLMAYCAQILMVAHKKRVVHQLRDSQGRRKHSKSGWVDINSPTVCEV